MEMLIACFVVVGVSRRKEVRVGNDGDLFGFCVCSAFHGDVRGLRR